MKTIRTNAKRILATLVIALSPILMIAPAQAGTCEGTVHGLSNTYNAKTGSGFLAIRKKKSSKSRMVGELFNGDVVTIWIHEGRWYQVDNGWVYDSYVDIGDCNF